MMKTEADKQQVLKTLLLAYVYNEERAEYWSQEDGGSDGSDGPPAIEEDEYIDNAQACTAQIMMKVREFWPEVLEEMERVDPTATAKHK